MLSACSNLGSFPKVWRYFPASRPARSPGDVSGILIDSAYSVVRRVWTFTYYRAGAAIWKADTGKALNGHSPPVEAVPRLRAHVFSDISQNPTTAMFARPLDAVARHDCPLRP